MQEELTPRQAIEIAIKDVHEAMIKNIEVGKLLIDTMKEKDTARYALHKAKDRLTALERMYME